MYMLPYFIIFTLTLAPILDDTIQDSLTPKLLLPKYPFTDTIQDTITPKLLLLKYHFTIYHRIYPNLNSYIGRLNSYSAPTQVLFLPYLTEFTLTLTSILDALTPILNTFSYTAPTQVLFLPYLTVFTLTLTPILVALTPILLLHEYCFYRISPYLP